MAMGGLLNHLYPFLELPITVALNEWVPQQLYPWHIAWITGTLLKAWPNTQISIAINPQLSSLLIVSVKT